MTLYSGLNLDYIYSMAIVPTKKTEKLPTEEFVEDGRLLKELSSACERGDNDQVRKLMGRIPPTSKCLKHFYKPPIFWACKAGQYKTVVILVKEFKCDPHYVSERGHTLVHVACARGHVEVARYLALEQSVDPNKANNDGATPLLSACNNGHLKVVSLLLDELKCDPQAVGENNKSLLHIACRNGHTEIVRLLVEKYGLDPNAKDSFGETPLHIACSKGHLVIVKYLVDELKCQVEVFDRCSTTPLHNACRNGQVDIVQHLVDGHQCSLRMYDHLGFMPFHVACRYGRKDIIKLLLDRGFDPNTPTLSNDTPIEIVRDKDTTTVLIQKGARTKGLKIEILHHYRVQQPLESLVYVLVIGHEGSGKSTIVKALQTPLKLSYSFMKIFGSCMVEGDSRYTKGIVPIRFHSQEFGNLMIFDFAGQYDYHPSHAAVLEHSNTSSAPLFLLVVSLTELLEVNKRRINYWVNFVENNPIPGAKHPHAIVIASHRDELRKRYPKDYQAQISALEGCTRSRFKSSKITLDGFFALDCRELSSDKHFQLRKQLKCSCDMLRSNIEVDACCHVLMVVLLKEFEGKISCTIEEVSAKVGESDYPLSTNAQHLCELAEALSSRTEILFIRHKLYPEKSWILLQMNVFLTEIHGRIFAPKHFRKSLEASEAGVVQWSQIRECFSDFPDPNLAVAFLGHFEECKVIDDPEVLMLIDEDIAKDCSKPTGIPFKGFGPNIVSPRSPEDLAMESSKDGPPSGASSISTPSLKCPELSPHELSPHQDIDRDRIPPSPPGSSRRCSEVPVLSEKYLFIPGLISADHPSNGVWRGREGYTFYSGWCLQCPEKKFFEARFLQALLLRLTFGFAVSPSSARNSTSRPTSLLPHKRECTLWKNGLRWLSLDGIEVIVEFVEDQTAILVLMRAKELSMMKTVKLRSALIQKILEAKSDYCPNMNTSESLIDPKHLEGSYQYPVISKPLTSLNRYDITAIAQAFMSRSPYVYDTRREGFLLVEKLVYFDPYNGVTGPILSKLYDHEESKELRQDLLQDFSFCHQYNAQHFKEILLSQYPLWYHKEFNKKNDNWCLEVLLWYLNTAPKTVTDFRNDLDMYSLFAGRNILEVELSTSPVTELTGKHSLSH